MMSDNGHNKLLKDIDRFTVEIKLKKPSMTELRIIAKQIITKELIKFDSQDTLCKIIFNSQNDIRRLILNLQDIRNTISYTITMTKLDEYFKKMQEKNIDFMLFGMTQKLLYNYASVIECLKYYKTEKVLMPLMIHQNYINRINSSPITKQSKIKTIGYIADILSVSDVIENYIYGDQHWYLMEIHGFYVCAVTSYIINNMTTKSDMSESGFIPHRNMRNPKIDYSKDLNRTSIKKINKKKINAITSMFPSIRATDIIYISSIIENAVQKNNIKDIVDILKGYHIDLNQLESIVKANKLGQKLVISPIMRRNISNLLCKNS